MINDKPYIVNIYGGPGAGKSTTAAGVFSQLKLKGINCELVTEYAKDLTYERRHNTLENQIYVFAKQYHRIHRVLSHDVDFIITDSPILLSLAYLQDNSVAAAEFRSLVKAVHESMNTLDYKILRVKPYKKYGRSQNEEEAVSIDTKINELTSFKKEVNGDVDGVDEIVDDIVSLYTLMLRGKVGV